MDTLAHKMRKNENFQEWCVNFIVSICKYLLYLYKKRKVYERYAFHIFINVSICIVKASTFIYKYMNIDLKCKDNKIFFPILKYY